MRVNGTTLHPHRLSIRILRQVLQTVAAASVGKAVGEKAVAKGIKEVCFDRARIPLSCSGGARKRNPRLVPSCHGRR